jgi:hypothetical protein
MLQVLDRREIIASLSVLTRFKSFHENRLEGRDHTDRIESRWELTECARGRHRQ